MPPFVDAVVWPFGCPIRAGAQMLQASTRSDCGASRVVELVWWALRLVLKVAGVQTPRRRLRIACSRPSIGISMRQGPFGSTPIDGSGSAYVRGLCSRPWDGLNRRHDTPLAYEKYAKGAADGIPGIGNGPGDFMSYFFCCCVVFVGSSSSLGRLMKRRHGPPLLSLH